ncbi:MAG: hypothetical protein DRQ88_04880 [Epsilonproteobacteria bacterium]|nr:MAG: hypothetical protein DRQ89_08280 [Campylobacterota bacterium]RLA66869.1 MAG: hypothetical protein DRQ88_04880 [Campylobacterota bacterium]
MSTLKKTEPNKINTLASTLLSTLDEKKFFGKLSSFIAKKLDADNSFVFLVLEDKSTKLIVKNGKKVKKEKILAPGEGPSGHVVRTKSPYFSNNVARDPLFSGEIYDEDINGELIIPVAHEGIMVATIHFQLKGEDKVFNIEQLTLAKEILITQKLPVANMKMYLAAKNLNDALSKKIDTLIQEKEKKMVAKNIYKALEPDINYQSKAMTSLIDLADKISKVDGPVLIQGESATGKEIIAKRIHCRSARKDRPFFVVSTSSFTEENLETELFGLEILNSSGKLMVRPGIFERANGGTILIKGLSRLNSNIQSRLTQLIKNKKIMRSSGSALISCDVRIIASVQNDIEELMEKEIIGQELFYFFNSIKVPSLRDRAEDIELLATKFLNGTRTGEEQKTLAPGVVKALKDYSWPGNIRELRNAMEQAYLLSEGRIIEQEHLAKRVIENKGIEEEKELNTITFCGMTLGDLERKHICDTLLHTQGNKTKTAKLLGITVKTLYNKLHSYGMINPKV